MDLIRVLITDLHEDPRNARKHSQTNLDAIKASLTRFGQQKPIVIDDEGTVVAGNGTLAAARELGWSAIDAVRTQLGDADATAYAIADNRTAELAAWDDNVLRETLAALKMEDEDLLAAAGFSEEDYDGLVDRLAEEDDVAVPSIYQVVATCADEAEQRDVFEMLRERGVGCRVNTL